jgi:hypothetical protein
MSDTSQSLTPSRWPGQHPMVLVPKQREGDSTLLGHDDHLLRAVALSRGHTSKPLDQDEARALKKLRQRWLKSADQLNVDVWIARYEWRQRFPALRETLDWGQDLRT